MAFDMVFNGGGAKGLAFAGALQAFEAAGHTHGRLIGTSAGAITAVYTGAGYNADELLAICSATDPVEKKPVLATFLDPPLSGDFSEDQIKNSLTAGLLKDAHIPEMIAGGILHHLLKVDLYRELFSFNECGGFYAGDKALNWFRQVLGAKGLDVTWEEFYAKTGADVSVVTTDVTHSQMVVLNHRTAPNCPVAISMRMSMSIPFVWREMIWDSAWGEYLGTVWPGETTFVDGGVLSNFALELLTDSLAPQVRRVMGDPPAAPNPVLGLYLDSKTAVAGAETSDTKPPRLRAAERVMNLIDTMTDSHDLVVMEQYKTSVCRIPTGGYGTTEFRMSAERQKLLIDSGRQAMVAYLGALPAPQVEVVQVGGGMPQGV
jgi:predicted acylesterase/phospholipase RssA